MEERGVLKRKRCLKDCETLLMALIYYIIQKKSFRALSDLMKIKHGITMSDTAWRKQILKAADVLLEIVQELVDITESEQNTYIIDATDLSCEGGKGTAVRVHTMYAPENPAEIFCKITDGHTAESVKNFPAYKGKLYLADRAYAKPQQLAYLQDRKANYLIRLSPYQIKLYHDSECKERINMDSLLSGDSFSEKCYFRYNKKVYSTRIIGERIPEDKRFIAQKRVKRKASKKCYKLSQKTLLSSQWLVLITTLPNDNLYELYRTRWQIELFFKRAKSLFNFHRLPRSSALYQIAVVKIWFSFAILISSFSFPEDLFRSFSLALSLLP